MASESPRLPSRRALVSLGAAAAAAAAATALRESKAHSVIPGDDDVADLITHESATQRALDDRFPVLVDGKISKADLPISSQSVPVLNVLEFGAKGDGATDDSAAVSSALSAATSGGQLEACRIVYFPAGAYAIRGGVLAVPPGSTVRIIGAGRGSTTLKFVANAVATDELVSLGGVLSSLENLTVDGSGATGGDLVVLGAAYTKVVDVLLRNGGASGIVLGKRTPAIVATISGVLVRDCAGYGIHVDGTDSTDGLWSNIDVGQSGLSGIRIEAAGHNLINVHVWGSGMSSSTDNSGFVLLGVSHLMSNCQSETNLGDGITIGGSIQGNSRTIISASKFWGNVGVGVRGAKADRVTLSGVSVFRNSIGNTQADDENQAGIVNDSGKGWIVAATSVWDDGATVPAKDSPRASLHFDGRTTAVKTQTFAYSERGQTEATVISGCSMRADQTLSGVAISSTSQSLIVSATDVGPQAPEVPARESISLPSWSEIVNISGSNVVTEILSGASGRRHTLVFTDAQPGGVVSSSPTLRLTGPFLPTQNGTLTLLSINSSWIEQARFV